MRTGVASAVGARRHNENNVTVTIAGLWRYDDWRHVATGCTALVAVYLWYMGWLIYWIFCSQAPIVHEFVVVCCIMYDSCAQWYAHTYQQFLWLTISLDLHFLYAFRFVLCFFRPFCSWIVCFCCVRFSFFRRPTMPRDQLQEERVQNDLLSAEWDIKPQLSSQSINKSVDSMETV